MIKMIGPDSAGMRDYIFSFMDLNRAENILDVGCNTGKDLFRISELSGKKDIKLMGVDIMEDAIEEAVARTQGDGRFVFKVHDADKPFFCEDKSFDIIYSNNFIECVTDKEEFLREMARMARKDGKIIFTHFDWDSQVLDGDDKELVRKIVRAFSEWKQPWMKDIDSWMGRRLYRTFNRTGLFEGDVYPYVIKNTEFRDPFYGYNMVNEFRNLVQEGIITKDEYERFYANLEELNRNGEFFYSITMYIYVGKVKDNIEI